MGEGSPRPGWCEGDLAFEVLAWVPLIKVFAFSMQMEEGGICAIDWRLAIGDWRFAMRNNKVECSPAISGLKESHASKIAYRTEFLDAGR